MATMEIYALVATPQAANGAGVADDTVWSGNDYIDHQNDNTSVNISKITIHRGTSDIVFTASGTQSGITVNFAPGNDANAVTIAGLLAGDKITYEAPEHDRLEIQNIGNANAGLNASFDIGGLQMESGGTATSPVNPIDFYDDGPSVAVSATGAPSLTVDESNFAGDDTKSFAGQFTPSYGTDGAGAGGITYALSTPGGASGLVDTLTGQNVVLSRDSVTGNIEGRTATSNELVFVVSVDSSGNVTLDEKRAVVHLPNSGPDQTATMSGSNLVVLSATVHDKDNDPGSANLDLTPLLNFKDDAPTITSQIQGGSVAFAADATGTLTNSLNGSVGADAITNVDNLSQAGVKQYIITSWDAPHTVYANLNGVLSADGTTLTYYSDLADTNAVYRVTLNQTANSGAGSYLFEVLQPPPLVQTHFNFTDLPSGQNLFGIIAQNKADLTKGGLLVFPSNPVLAADGTMTNTSGTINTSKGGGPVTIGNGNQAFDDPSEGAVFMYVNNPASAAVGGLGLTQTSADDADTIRFNGMIQATDASVSVVQTSGSANKTGPSMHIFAWEVNPGNVNTDAAARAVVTNPTAGGTQIDIVGVKIHDSTGAVIEYRTVNQAAGGANTGTLIGPDSVVGIQFILDNPNGAGTADDVYSAVISNLKAGYTVEWLTSANHDLAIVQNVSGSYDIGGFDVINRANLAAQDFHLSAQISDYDNDLYGGPSVTYANWTVHVNEAIFA
jgi:hypothetical protein